MRRRTGKQGVLHRWAVDWDEEDGEIMESTSASVLVETDGLMNGHLGLELSVPSVEVFQQGVLSEPEADAELKTKR